MPQGEGGGRVGFPFVGIPSFLGSAICTDLDSLDADIAVLGAPTDEGSPFMPGSRFGARSIREHSLRFVTDGRGYYDPRARRRFLEREMVEGRIADVGDADVLPTNVVDTFANITALTRGVIERGAMPVALGGDHAITYPVVRAFEGEEPFHVVHFDAHIDYMPFVHGLEFTSYVSVDIDVLDMSLIPGCVSAEPDGMSYAELRDAMLAVAERTRVIGLDLVEVNPLLDVRTGLTSYLAAHIVVESLGRICDQPWWRERR